MDLANISVPVDADTARIYQSATKEQQRKLRLLMTLWIRDFIATPRPLEVIMDEASDMARANGLTPEILESILHAS